MKNEKVEDFPKIQSKLRRKKWIDNKKNLWICSERIGT